MNNDLIKSLTGGVSEDFTSLHSEFREFYVTGEIAKLSNAQYLQFKRIENAVWSTQDHFLARLNCKDALRHLSLNPTNEYFIFECLEWLKFIQKKIVDST
jgi:hypothetical protein